MYLVDTNVLSVAAPGHPQPGAVVDWMTSHAGSLFLSVVTIAEIEEGVAKLRRMGAVRRSERLAEWLEIVLHLYSARLHVFDKEAARIAGALTDRERGAGHAPGFADIVIAATAQRHGLTILSRNLRHFGPLGVPALDPFAALPRR